MANLPVEILQQILIEAARIQLESSPRNAADLQLIARETRKCLLPTLFCVFIVHWPLFLVPQAPATPSLAFLFHMLANPDSSPRTHVRHIVILPPRIGLRDTYRGNSFGFVEWTVDSVVLAPDQQLQLIHELRLVPRRIFIPGPGRGLNECRQLIRSGWRDKPMLRALEELYITCPIVKDLEPLSPFLAGHPTDIIAGSSVQDIARTSFQVPLRVAASTDIVTLRMHLDVESKSQIASAVLLVEAAVQAPGLRVVLVLLDYRTSHDDAVHALCAALTESVVLCNSPHLTVKLAQRRAKPENGVKYATALREGYHDELFRHGISLTALTAMI